MIIYPKIITRAVVTEIEIIWIIQGGFDIQSECVGSHGVLRSTITKSSSPSSLNESTELKVSLIIRIS